MNEAGLPPTMRFPMGEPAMVMHTEPFLKFMENCVLMITASSFGNRCGKRRLHPNLVDDCQVASFDEMFHH